VLNRTRSTLLRRALLLSVLGLRVAFAGEGESTLEVKSEGFWDRNGVWNLTPAFALTKIISEKWRWSWEQEFDVVSGASRRLGARRVPAGDAGTDIVSGASKVEFRHSENPGITYSHQGTVASANFYFSRESDYTSLSPSAAVSRDFNDRNTTVGASYAEFFDTFHPRGDFRGQGGDKRIRSLGLNVAQSLTPLTLVAATGTYIDSWGYLGHPYNPPIDSAGVMRTESVPDRKRAVALAVQAVQGYHVFADALGSVNLDVRRYGDSWRMRSTTVDLKVSQYVTETGYVRLRGRYYTQTGASFARDYYRGDETYRTADVRWYPFSSFLTGVKFSGGFPESWESHGWLPARWDVQYDHLIRDTRGDARGFVEGEPRRLLYQLYDPDTYYSQDVIMLGLLFNL
jgi:hypothetical protein